METFETALARFRVTVQAHIEADYAVNTPNVARSNVPTLSLMEGRRYVRVVVSNPHRSCFCFIDRTNGDVLKSDGWKGPAKGPRGTIYTEDFSKYGVTTYGAQYR